MTLLGKTFEKTVAFILGFNIEQQLKQVCIFKVSRIVSSELWEQGGGGILLHQIYSQQTDSLHRPEQRVGS